MLPRVQGERKRSVGVVGHRLFLINSIQLRDETGNGICFGMMDDKVTSKTIVGGEIKFNLNSMYPWRLGP